MKQVSCSWEEAVARAAGTGVWPEAIATHAKQCSLCCEVAQISHRMGSLANSISGPIRPLPDPGLIWRRAHLDQEDAKKTGTALEWVQIGSATVAPLGLAGWVAWNWFSLEAMAEEFLVAHWPQLSTSTYALALLAPVALTAAALALAYPLFDSVFESE